MLKLNILKMKFDGSEIVDFYRGKSIFLTGGTGFVGKAILQKILRTCPEVDKIFVLIRSKRSANPTARLEALLNEPIFEGLRKLQPQFPNRVVAIPGDISLPKLGISNRDTLLIQENVSVVIHSAATVKFNEPLKDALRINLGGTYRVLEIAETLKLLMAVVYVSTAFSNCEMSFIEEKVYPTKFTAKNAMYCLENLSDDLVESITPTLLGDKPNTYTFSKHLAEELINEWKPKLPVCIVRPSIITATEKDPVPGFVDNFTAMSGILAGIMTGCIHSLYFNDKYRIEIIPLDHVVNATLVAACRLGKADYGSRSGLQIYNLTSCENPLSFKAHVLPVVLESLREKPLRKSVGRPYVYATTKAWVHRLLCFLLHWLPAFCSDFVPVGLVGKQKIRLMPIQDKVARNINLVEYFTTRTWTLLSDNTKALYNSLNNEDKRLFPFNVQDIDWNSYMPDYVSGLRTFGFKETDDYRLDGSKNSEDIVMLVKK